MLDVKELARELDDLRLSKDEGEEHDADRLKELQDLEDDLGGDLHVFARNGEALIPDSDFEDYARELAEDIHGSELRKASWPFDCIDWSRAASELQIDYTSVEFDGETYWYRA